MDPAASSFCKDGKYVFEKSGAGAVSREELLDLYARMVRTYPIVSIEDGFAEDDWEAFRAHNAMLGDRIQIVGDDLYVTNRAFIRRGIREHATNAVLIKVNQVGTLSETLDALLLARRNGYRPVVSARSGETEDATIADLAVATAAGQIKIGSVVRSERLAKYNRLLRIEEMLGSAGNFAGRDVVGGGAP